MHRSKLLLATAILAMTALISACHQQPQATPTPTRTPAGPMETGESAPVETPAAPHPTPQAQPAAGPVGPDSYPDNVNPLTGLILDDVSVLQRPPLAIKVSNDPLARPQSGLTNADLVFEHYAEGNVTRLTAIFFSQGAERVGSVRSGRLLDLEIVPMFDAIFAASGFSDGVRAKINNSTWADRNLSGPFVGAPALVRIQDPGVALEHTLFAIPDELWALAEERGVSKPPDLTPGMAFDTTPPSGGTPANTISINFGPSSAYVQWKYDPATGRYYRWNADEPHLDALNDEQIGVENVVAVGAMHVETDIIEDSFGGGHYSIEIQIWGEGPISVFRDGQRFEGRWQRLDPEEMMRFTDLNGNTMYLKPGQTWFEMVPLGFDQLFVE
jgi:hypothetical protein